MALQSFGSDLRVAIFGASGGIGGAFVSACMDDPAIAQVHTVSRGGGAEGHTAHRCDVTDEDDIARVAEAIGPVHLVIVAIGILHGDGIAPEKTWRHLDPAVMAHVLAINTIAPAIIAKQMLPKLETGRKTAFAALSARVGSISDNRLGGWISYRASKAALNMAIKTLSIELRRVNRDALIVGLHPGTVNTGLSEPFSNNVPEKQLFSPIDSATKLLAVLDALTPEQSGRVFAYDGMEIEP